MSDRLIEVKADIETLAKEVKSLTAQIEGYKALHQEEVSRLTIALENLVNPAQAKIDALSQQIKVLSYEAGCKETKTQYSLQLLESKIVVKKSCEKITKPTEKAALEQLMNNYPQYTREDIVKTFEWKEFSKGLEIVDGNVIDKDTGELVGSQIGFSLIKKSEEKVIVE